MSQRRPLHHSDLADLSVRARKPNSARPRPFIKWAGSKRSLLPHLVDVVPSHYGTYFEPFLGSGALFFLLRPHRAFLTDVCGELIATFSAVRDNVNVVARYLKEWEPDRELFYRMRKHRSRGHLKRAAEFLYLNKVCWNGLYRVNTRGEFNVPYGRPKSQTVADFANLQACAQTLKKTGIQLWRADFEETLAGAGAGDLVYLDPPYVTGHNNNGFVDYNEKLFCWEDQERLAIVARLLANRGVNVIVTNAHHRKIVRLYEGFARKSFSRCSTIASSPTFRRKVSEIIFYSTSSHNGRGNL